MGIHTIVALSAAAQQGVQCTGGQAQTKPCDRRTAAVREGKSNKVVLYVMQGTEA